MSSVTHRNGVAEATEWVDTWDAWFGVGTAPPEADGVEAELCSFAGLFPGERTQIVGEGGGGSHGGVRAGVLECGAVSIGEPVVCGGLFVRSLGGFASVRWDVEVVDGVKLERVQGFETSSAFDAVCSDSLRVRGEHVGCGNAAGFAGELVGGLGNLEVPLDVGREDVVLCKDGEGVRHSGQA